LGTRFCIRLTKQKEEREKREKKIETHTFKINQIKSNQINNHIVKRTEQNVPYSKNSGHVCNNDTHVSLRPSVFFKKQKIHKYAKPSTAIHSRTGTKPKSVIRVNGFVVHSLRLFSFCLLFWGMFA
jgi:hypothetical protein